MSKSGKRPVNLNILSFSFPLPSLVSIAHRISGVVLFLVTPIFLYLLSHVLGSASCFNDFTVTVERSLWLKLVLWLSLLALLYHIIAGVRHLIMDLGIGESFKAARLSAAILMGVFLVITVLTGVWVWA